jgi:hypothetical protein
MFRQQKEGQTPSYIIAREPAELKLTRNLFLDRVFSAFISVLTTTKASFAWPGVAQNSWVGGRFVLDIAQSPGRAGSPGAPGPVGDLIFL